MFRQHDEYSVSIFTSIALFAFRLVMGSAFLFHGLPKIQHPFSWLGEEIPGFLQALAAFSEFGGGLALLVGLFTPLACLGILATMIGAIIMVHLPAGHPFVSSSGGHSSELALMYLGAALLLLMVGPGKFSLDNLFFRMPHAGFSGFFEGRRGFHKEGT